MTSGAIEQDFSNITPGEAITLRWAIEDSAGVAIPSFASPWAAKVFITNTRGAANGLTELEAGSLLEIDPTLAVPNISAAMTPANWATMSAEMQARVYYYELWRTDSGNETRLAYGKITTID
jgi:hypothetical protein